MSHRLTVAVRHSRTHANVRLCASAVSEHCPLKNGCRYMGAARCQIVLVRWIVRDTVSAGREAAPCQAETIFLAIRYRRLIDKNYLLGGQ